jgi:hypothetical protein
MNDDEGPPDLTLWILIGVATWGCLALVAVLLGSML